MKNFEQWKDIPGHDGHYQASNRGHIRSMDRIVPGRQGPMKRKGITLKPSINGPGYLQVTLRKDSKPYNHRVHRLVALTWLGPCPEGQEVLHGTNGQLDNSIDNIRYDTHQINCLEQRLSGTHGGCKVRRSDGKLFQSLTEASESVGKNFRNISSVCRGRRKTCGGFSWEYA